MKSTINLTNVISFTIVFKSIKLYKKLKEKKLLKYTITYFYFSWETFIQHYLEVTTHHSDHKDYYGPPPPKKKSSFKSSTNNHFTFKKMNAKYITVIYSTLAHINLIKM